MFCLYRLNQNVFLFLSTKKNAILTLQVAVVSSILILADILMAWEDQLVILVGYVILKGYSPALKVTYVCV